MQAPSPLLDREALERLERLTIRWRQSFQGLLGGQNVSRYAGVGHEFLDHRHFQPGDDLRKINWRAYLRLGRLFLKMFRTEPRTPVRLFIDTSESMACGAEGGAGGEPKFHYACRLAAALCYVGLVRLETIVLQPFGAELGESFRAGGGRHRFAAAAEFLSGLSTGGTSNFSGTAREFLSHDPAPGPLIMLSDFFDDTDCSDALGHLAGRGHELLLVQLSGPDDARPAWKGEIELVDSETGRAARMRVDQATIDQYAKAYEDFRRHIDRTARRNRGGYIHVTTDISLQDVLYGAVAAGGGVSLR